MKSLRKIPGVGPKLAWKFEHYLNIKRPSCFKGKNPEKLFQKLGEKMGAHVDRCVLYVLRECVYYAENKKHDTEKLKWWNLKD